jgi:ABC-type polysaccharide/polyol phosphate transport system ATPase subunit
MIQPRRSVAAQLFFVCAYLLVMKEFSVRASQSQEMGKDEEVKRGAVGGGIWWKDLGVMQKNGHFLLNPFSGFVENGHVCGIIGPSGSGKSTFLAALGGSTLKQSGLHVSGSVWIVSNDTQTKSSLSIRYDAFCAISYTDAKKLSGTSLPHSSLFSIWLTSCSSSLIF